MRLNDTIVAVASGWSPGHRAVIRLSGPDTVAALTQLVGETPAPGVHAARLKLAAGQLPGLVTLFRSPNSYTGEDGAEIQLPGGPAIVDQVLHTLMAAPASTPGAPRPTLIRQAEPGEFTARAFLNRKLTAEQAEGVAALIAARSDQQFRAARSLLEGHTGRGYRVLADELAHLLALVEAGIDFTDQEDVVPIPAPELAARLHALEQSLGATLHSGAAAPPAREPVIVVAGPPNAGKSTLFNALLGRARSVVSPRAGTTRDAVRERLSLDSGGWGPSFAWLVDIAGLDESLASRSQIDAAAQQSARAVLSSADIVVWCEPAQSADPIPSMSNPSPNLGRAREPARTIPVKTKADLLNGPHSQGIADPSLRVCALDGWNLGALRRAISDAALLASSHGSQEAALLPRHRAALAQALHAVRAALQSASQSSTAVSLDRPELVAGELRAALDALGQITGRVSPDDVIGRIFSTFCVGK